MPRLARRWPVDASHCLLFDGRRHLQDRGGLELPVWRRGWPLASGVIDLVLGVLIWMELPESALWVIGLYVGINLVFRGVHWIALGLGSKSLPRPATH